MERLGQTRWHIVDVIVLEGGLSLILDCASTEVAINGRTEDVDCRPEGLDVARRHGARFRSKRYGFHHERKRPEQYGRQQSCNLPWTGPGDGDHDGEHGNERDWQMPSV